MAVINKNSVILKVTPCSMRPTTVERDEKNSAYFRFGSQRIDANASMTLTGAAGENVGGWILGFIQLKYIGTQRVHYRGATVHDGSRMHSWSNKILCRDTDDNSGEVWYDSIYAGGVIGPEGTNKLAADTVLPQDGSLEVRAHMFDGPYSLWPDALPNTLVPGIPYNYLHYVVIEKLFCTMLVARDPAGVFHMLKHFYWSVVWEQKFKRDAITGKVVVDQAIRLQQNVQRPPRNGNPIDPRFFGREYDLSLPISNAVSKSDARVVQARDWSQG